MKHQEFSQSTFTDTDRNILVKVTYIYISCTFLKTQSSKF